MGIFSKIGSALTGAVTGFISGGPIGALVGGVGGLLGGSRPAAPRPPMAAVPVPLPPSPPGMIATAGFQPKQTQQAGTALQRASFPPGTQLGGPATPLQAIQLASGVRVTRQRVRDLARVCGIDETATRFGVPQSVICDIIVSRTRRSRGISAADLRRTRATIRKINSMSRQLSQLCGPTRRRAARRSS